MNMKQALYFKTIAQYGTITAAAKQLYISQPSLSQTLRQIEDEVGTPLFDRSTSPFHLTYAGERYLKAVEAMLDIETRLKEEIESIRRDDGGRLRLGISVTRAMQVLPDVIPIFTKAYPNRADGGRLRQSGRAAAKGADRSGPGRPGSQRGQHCL